MDINKKHLLFIILFVVLPAFFSMADEPTKYEIKTVVIDAGHGGKDSGALGKHSKEKDIVLAVSLKVGKYIEENFPGINVIYTRKTDVFVELDERANIANKANADLFISIHANAEPKNHAKGTETFTIGNHKTESNLEVAKLENSVILLEDDYSTRYEGFDPNSIESYIVFELIQHVYSKQSISFASDIQDQFRDRVKRIDRGVKQAGLLVLWKTTMPGVLIELGFITHPDEEAYLLSEQGQDYLASAIYRAFKNYKQNIEQQSNYQIEIERPVDTSPPSKDTTVIENPTPSVNKTPNPSDNSIKFRVQILSSSGKIDPNDKIYKIYDPVFLFSSGEIHKYAVGSFDEYKHVKDFVKDVKVIYPDAFVIATQGNQIIPLNEAIKKNK